MPGRQRIDTDEAERLYSELGDWNEVAGVLSQGRKGPGFQRNSVQHAVRIARRARAAAAAEIFDVGD